MAKITIDSEALDRGINDLMKSITGMDSVTSKLHELVGTIQQSWNGSSGVAYGALMNAYEQQAKEMKGVMESYKEYVEKANATFTKLDQDSAQKIRSSF